MTSKWVSGGQLFRTVTRLAKPWFWTTLQRFSLIIGVLGVQESKQILYKTTPARHMLTKTHFGRISSQKGPKSKKWKIGFYSGSGTFSELDAFWCHFCPQAVSNTQMYPKMMQKGDPTDTIFDKHIQVSTPKLWKGFDVVFQGRRVSRSVLNIYIYIYIYIYVYMYVLVSGTWKKA